jgi:hypothetical protein
MIAVCIRKQILRRLFKKVEFKPNFIMLFLYINSQTIKCTHSIFVTYCRLCMYHSENWTLLPNAIYKNITNVNCYTIYNGPTNALVCNKTLIQMSHTKTLKITPTCCDHQMIIIVLCGEACRHVDMPLHTIQNAKWMTVCCRITTLEDSNFNQWF